MNHTDYLAALDRLRMLNNPSVDQRVKAIYCHADAVLADKATIYDAEHDPTPATVEWLKSIGFMRLGDGRELRMGLLAMSFAAWCNRWSFYFENRFIVNNPTCGDVLRLLGVFKKEVGR